MNFKVYLRTLLAQRGMTQDSLASAAGVDAGQLSRHLSGEFIPRAETLERFVKVLNCTPDERLELYRLAGRMPQEITEAFCSSNLMARFFRMVAQLGHTEVERVVREWNEQHPSGTSAEGSASQNVESHGQAS